MGRQFGLRANSDGNRWKQRMGKTERQFVIDDFQPEEIVKAVKRVVIL